MTCACGCGTTVSGLTRGKPRRFVSGHNLLVLERTDAHRANIAAALRLAWRTKRKRCPVGSKRKDHQGYIRVKVVRGAGRWGREHVLLMEKTLRRKLRPGEHVHHINCVRDDNRLENLHLFKTSGEHSAAHGSIGKLLRSLLESGLVRFDRNAGRYELASKK